MTDEERELLKQAWSDVAILLVDPDVGVDRKFRALLMYFALTTHLDAQGFAIVTDVMEWVMDWRRNGASDDQLHEVQLVIAESIEMAERFA